MLFRSNGSTKEEYSYFNNKLHGTFKEYTIEGKIYRYQVFNFGKNITPCYIYYENDNKINFIIYYNDSQDSGKIENYSEEQYLISIHHFKNNRKDGLCLKYYNNGLLSEKCFYKNNLLHGNIEKYCKNGECYLKGTYKNGKRNGIFTKIDDIMIEKIRFKDDLRHVLYVLKNRQTKKKILILYYDFDKLNGIQNFILKKSKRFYRDNYFMLIESKKKVTCSICWNKSRWKTPCNHALCIDCSKQIQNLECPLCRRLFIKKKSIVINPFNNNDFMKED